MILLTDVHYPPLGGAWAAGLGCARWDDPSPASEQLVYVPEVADYEPGQFYRRELPCLLALLQAMPLAPEVIVVDGHAWLNGRPGLGARLREATGLPVVGVAKRRFFEGDALPLLRGGSQSPLYVSAAGIPAEEALAYVSSMHGPHRLPTLLKRVDRLCRDAAEAHHA
ncbi:endonuclease V [Myxococcota bacterium]|nr:endonuclease V [Myxococcota bacterium]